MGRIWIEHLRAVDPSTDEKATAERFGWKYYLPEAEQEEDVNVKLAEIRTTYKDLKPTDITCIDPCMGSGHILIAMFDVLMDIYESAGYDKREAAFEIVEHNIHGLDIDQRAYQLAYFAVMMKGRGYNRRFLRGRDGKPEPKVYAIVESNEINRNHLQFFGTHLSEMERNLATMQIEGLLDTFKDAREYGSILNVDACDWDVLKRFVDDLGTNGQISFESVGSEETQEQLSKLVRVAKNLGQKYDAVVTNPPYMGSSNMNCKLLDYVKAYYNNTKSDLSTVMMEKSLELCNKSGYMVMINIPVWMFLSSYEKMRKVLLKTNSIYNMLHFGRGIFGADFGTTAFVMKKGYIPNYKANYRRLFDKQSSVDSVEQKQKWFFEQKGIFSAKQEEFDKIPGIPVAYWISEAMFKAFEGTLLGDYGKTRQGFATGDNDTFLRLWYEVAFTDIGMNFNDYKEFLDSNYKYAPCNKGGDFRKWYGNNYMICRFDSNAFHILASQGNHLPSKEYYFKEGLTWSALSIGMLSMRFAERGFIFETKGSRYFLNDNKCIYYLLGLMNSAVAMEALKVLCPTIDFHEGPVSKVPVILGSVSEIEEINDIVKENINFAKSDWDSSEISWDFKKHILIPEVEKNQNSLRIEDIFFEKQKETDSCFKKLKHNEERLNKLFLHIYEMDNELETSIDDNYVSVEKLDLQKTMKSFISYAVGCMFGRYCIRKDGLVFAGGDFKQYYKKVENEKNSSGSNSGLRLDGEKGFIEQYAKVMIDGTWTDISFAPDLDNCIPITDEEYFSDDIVSRFVEFVKSIYGIETLEENLRFIADALGNKGASARDVIRNYFIKDFYADHLKIYQKKPIYWLFDSGKQNGFKALVYLHRYNADTVGRVRTDYLHRAQKYVETAMQSAQYTVNNATLASEKSKATKAVTKYTKQLAEMKIYDEAIAHIANKRIEIDLDDGVKHNYEKFQGIEVSQEGKKTIKIDLLAKLK